MNVQSKSHASNQTNRLGRSYESVQASNSKNDSSNKDVKNILFRVSEVLQEMQEVASLLAHFQAAFASDANNQSYLCQKFSSYLMESGEITNNKNESNLETKRTIIDLIGKQHAYEMQSYIDICNLTVHDFETDTDEKISVDKPYRIDTLRQIQNLFANQQAQNLRTSSQNESTKAQQTLQDYTNLQALVTTVITRILGILSSISRIINP